MRRPLWVLFVLLIAASVERLPAQVTSSNKNLKAEFRTSDRCVACHNGLKTKSGEDISIGLQWQASIMANSARDPYWQGSIRRESIDHPESKADIENECSICHMPITHFVAKSEGRKAEVFSHLPLAAAQKHDAAADGVSCAVCHQIEKSRLGTPESFNGNFVIEGPQDKDKRPEYGPFVIDNGHQRVMESSTGGFVPQDSTHIRDSALCGSCHTLYTKAIGPGGQQIGTLPEQMPYLEWLHSDYPKKNTCQSCHMPEVHEAVAVTAIYGQPREGMHRHEFIGGNFLVQRILNEHRADLSVAALPEELTTAADRTVDFLKSQSARVTIQHLQVNASGVSLDVLVQNLTGHKFPTAYPSRRAWLHVTVQDRNGRVIFESGALNPDGSIVGNPNDADPRRYEPHHRQITSAQQVEIFEPILMDSHKNVTTGLLSAIGYLKDNRILPSGFDKRSADRDIAVVGDALDDPNFTDRGSLIRYLVNTGNAPGPFHIDVELWYQPIGFRWAHNLETYNAMEPQRFVGYYEAEARRSAVMLTKAEATR